MSQTAGSKDETSIDSYQSRFRKKSDRRNGSLLIQLSTHASTEARRPSNGCHPKMPRS